MKRTDDVYNKFLHLLREELVPATGCTEPIAIAYAAAKATKILGAKPDKAEIHLSGSIVKNAKSAIIPGTNGLCGIAAALAAGVCAGDAEKKLEVIADIPPSLQEEIAQYMNTCPTVIKLIEGVTDFEIILTVYSLEESAEVHISGAHTHIVSATKNSVPLAINQTQENNNPLVPRHFLSIRDIINFADVADAEDLRPIMERQRNYNYQLALEGLTHSCGSCIGKGLLAGRNKTDVLSRAKAYTAAAADARMSGCQLPAVITAGSGNQGITASLPVIIYAEALGVQEDLLYRAMALSALVTIHQKNAIGKLSAFCGAVCAGAGAGAGIAYLNGGHYAEISHTIVNALAILSGMVCDGAKPSCAAKIALSVEAGIMGYEMYAGGQEFRQGEGLVGADVEKTIANIGRLGTQGMEKTNRVILSMMVDDAKNKPLLKN